MTSPALEEDGGSRRKYAGSSAEQMPRIRSKPSADDSIDQHTPETSTFNNFDPDTTAASSAHTTNPPPSTDTQSTEAPNPATNPLSSSSHQKQQSPPKLEQNSHLTTLHTKISNLESQLSSLHSTLNTTHSQLRAQLLLGKQQRSISSPPTTLSSQPETEAEADADPASAAEQIVRKHISLLHTYNEIKDVGLGLMGMIAEERGVRVKEVVAEFGVGEGD